jgi:2-polyprenyl-3-methyl-5-hydroxy-6-metoxy-1,4-benzoquinol methylase
MTTNSLEHLHHEFRDFIERQPYSVTLDGLRLTIDKDVFPPDMGLCAQNLAHISQRYEPERALDMGCGTAYLALMLKMSGVSEVWASDIHEPAIACARSNAARNSEVGSINIVQSDLFEDLPSSVMTEAPAHLSENGVLLMPFSDREASQHSPHNVASELGYRVATVFDQYYSESNNFIFEIRPR